MSDAGQFLRKVIDAFKPLHNAFVDASIDAWQAGKALRALDESLRALRGLPPSHYHPHPRFGLRRPEDWPHA